MVDRLTPKINELLRNKLNTLPNKIWNQIGEIFIDLNDISMTHADYKKQNTKDKQIIEILVKAFQSGSIEQIKKTEWGKKIDEILNTKVKDSFLRGCEYLSQFKEEDIDDKTSFFIKSVQKYLFLNVIFNSLQNNLFIRKLESKNILNGHSMFLLEKYKEIPSILNIDNWINFTFNIDPESSKHIHEKNDTTNIIIERYFTFLEQEKLLSPKKTFKHSDFYRTIYFNDLEYTPSGPQATVIAFMHEKYKDGIKLLKSEEILTHLDPEDLKSYTRLRDIFKSSPLWNNLLKQDEKKGYYYLDLD
jgi:hypothetical protein